MAYVPVPKDLTAVKTKVMFNLTKRQLICFGAGGLLGLPAFFLLKSFISMSSAAMAMIVIVIPFFLLGMYEKNGQPLEVVLKNMIDVMFLKPKQRPYMTKNYYSRFTNTEKKEVNSVVQKDTTMAKAQKAK